MEQKYKSEEAIHSMENIMMPNMYYGAPMNYPQMPMDMHYPDAAKKWGN